jgi:hypothetical protein
LQAPLQLQELPQVHAPDFEVPQAQVSQVQTSHVQLAFPQFGEVLLRTFWFFAVEFFIVLCLKIYRTKV